MNDSESLIALLTKSRDCLTLQGVCRTFDVDAPSHRPSVQAVWVSGRCMRLEQPPGVLSTILGEDFVWHRWPDTGQVTLKPRLVDEGQQDPYSRPRILETDSIEYWTEVLREGSELTHQGHMWVEAHAREGVRVNVSTGAARHGLDLIIDEMTGVWLEARLDGILWLDWSDIRFDVDIEATLFHPSTA